MPGALCVKIDGNNVSSCGARFATAVASNASRRITNGEGYFYTGRSAIVWPPVT